MKTDQEEQPSYRLLVTGLAPWRRNARLWMSIALLLGDLVGLVLAFLLAILLRQYLPNGINPEPFIRFSPLLFIFPLVYALRGLYPAVGMNLVDEMRLLFGATTTVFILLMAATFWLHAAEIYSRMAVGFAWVFAIGLVQLNRWLVRILLRRLGAWGEPAVIIGTGAQTEQVLSHLQNRIRLGLLPAINIAGDRSPDTQAIDWVKNNQIQTAVVIVSELSTEMKQAVFDQNLYGFQRMILISNIGGVGSLGVIPHDLEGLLGLEVRQNLKSPWQRALKRLLDISVALVGGVLISPLLLLLAVLVRLDGPGSVLYTQKRVGRYGKLFDVIKFRTMVPDAEQRLAHILATDPARKAEWDATQKLKDDPRVTRVGRFIRKWSLDELPQLFNVLRGEMSLVGPRPCIPGEEDLFGEFFKQYIMVRPGMSGLWQVSGRNQVSYAMRNQLNEYYIRNWSIWLDFYILFRTVLVVIRRDGAY
ncbi:MAG: undecaprenyl-phosphate galactose phosphotransferase WbaP [Anaerolineae bacterium]|nr:undecaprenyl-phosphate galactose phosphotransferase WbaP [Anaerolineae bacterium]